MNHVSPIRVELPSWNVQNDRFILIEFVMTGEDETAYKNKFIAEHVMHSISFCALTKNYHFRLPFKVFQRLISARYSCCAGCTIFINSYDFLCIAFVVVIVIITISHFAQTNTTTDQ